MRDLVVTENITLDGDISGTGGWFGPATEVDGDGSDMLEELHAQSDASDAVLFGRVTFEAMRGYWPQHVDDPVGRHLDGVAKYVVSRTLTEPGWRNTSVLDGPLVDEVRRLKDRPGKDIVATGSITLVRSLIAEDLVDEFRLFVYPVVIGAGERLFQDRALKLALVEAKPFRNGVVLLRYRRPDADGVTGG
ncbi:dihydrofolate reductase family protein [Actinomadura rupiterrae]|uniref:dihydrofolate reductase family protein n=1 Tax=Actinomadura rupiterrae TaxID=559627 RepID=UPI0020A478F4|nr:dihydrofolate reductase family protein [Actinomadura rupiterrae]MCP2341217.1 dihydrofolate reductase [Actinomadura rupiterrae]